MKPTSLLRYSSGLVFSLALLAPAARADEGGALYTMDNAAGANHVLAFHRAEDGGLIGAGSFATGGVGAGAGLSSQGSVTLSRDGRWLFVCNAGSSEISVLGVDHGGGLSLADKVDSGGHQWGTESLH